MPGLSILRVVGNDELVMQEKEQAARELQERQYEPYTIGLTAYLHACSDAARQAKKPIENLMLSAMRQRNGEY